MVDGFFFALIREKEEDKAPKNKKVQRVGIPKKEERRVIFVRNKKHTFTSLGQKKVYE